MSKKIKDIYWLNIHYKPVESYVIGGKWYGIIYQHTTPTREGFTESFAIKCCDLNQCDRAPDEGTWLMHPEPRYETESGARLAILINADERLK